MGATYSQFFPPPPTLTEANLPSQAGKVFIVTGGAAGVGFELCRILYNAGGKVYIAGRSEKNASTAIEKIKKSSGSSSSTSLGSLRFLPLDLSNLNTIKPAVATFTYLESRLDVLFNNAGVSNPPQGSVDAHGNELQLGTNCLGHYLFSQLLIPILKTTSSALPPGSVRVIWTSSIACEFTPKDGIGLRKQDLQKEDVLKQGPQYNYTLSKTGNWFLAHELHLQLRDAGILSITQNPGNLRSELTRHFGWLVPWLASFIMYEARFGAYTELWCGLSEELNREQDGGGYVVPWGRRHEKPREDILTCLKTREEGGNGVSKEFGEWCEEMVRDYR